MKRIPGDLGDFGEGVSGDIDEDDLVLKLGNCGGYFGILLTDLLASCPSSASFSRLAILLRLMKTRIADNRPKLSRITAVTATEMPPGFEAIVVKLIVRSNNPDLRHAQIWSLKYV